MPPTDVSDEALEKMARDFYDETGGGMPSLNEIEEFAKRVRSICRAAAVEAAEGILSDLRELFPADDAEEGGEGAG